MRSSLGRRSSRFKMANPPSRFASAWDRNLSIFSAKFRLSKRLSRWSLASLALSSTVVGAHAQSANPLLPTRDYQGLPVFGWMLFPELTVGAVFDDNINGTATNKDSGVGSRVRGSFTAERAAGIHNTLLYGSGDFRYYPGVDDGAQVEGRIGAAHVYEAQRDLVFRFQGDASRQEGILGSGTGLAPAGHRRATWEPVGLRPHRHPTHAVTRRVEPVSGRSLRSEEFWPLVCGLGWQRGAHDL